MRATWIILDNDTDLMQISGGVIVRSSFNGVSMVFIPNVSLLDFGVE